MPANRPRINALIVEDSEQDALLMVYELEVTGRLISYERIDSEGDLVNALKKGGWDIVLSDYSLPRLNAHKVLDLVKIHAQHLPVVVVSGVVGEETAVELIKTGAGDFVLKDRLTRLSSVVERQLTEAELRDEREAVANALAEAQNLTELLFASVSEVAIIISNKDRTILKWSRGAENVFGYSAEEATGQSVDIIFLEEDRATGQPEREAATAAREGKVEDVRWHVCKSGERIYCDGVATPLYKKDGSLMGFAKIARDITEKKRFQDEREEMLREAMRTSRMKDEFLSTLSHELRTPLNAILGNAELLHSEDPASEYFYVSLETISRNARVQAQLIDDLLDISRIITGKMVLESEPVELRNVIDAAIESVALSAKSKCLVIRCEIEPDVPNVLGDSMRLLQAMWNLLTNAIKFTPKGGSVTVKLKKNRSRVELHVVDSGRGIAKEFLPHVFERFRQEEGAFNRRYGGLGLGLAIVQHVVEAHGGTIQVASAGIDQGASFTISLLPIPITNEAWEHGEKEIGRRLTPVPAPTADELRSHGRIKDKKILVIDDHADARDLVARILKKVGAEVHAVASGNDALRLLRNMLPDLVLCDIGMPVEDGYTVIRKIRTAYDPDHKIPAIALTAFARPEDAKLALESGFNVHLAKPVKPVNLLKVVADLLEKFDRSAE